MSALTIYQNRLKAVRSQTSATVAAQWDALPNYDKPQAEGFARRVAPVVAAGQLVAARTTNAYVSRLAGVPPVRLSPALVTGPAARRGVDPLEQYQRPFGIAWHALGEGTDYAEAVQQGRARAVLMAATDVWLASRVATEIIEQTSGRITGWVRAADGDACELCSAADGMSVAQAADFAGHPNCFPGDTLVSANAKIAMRRWYSGEMIVISTASGQELTATSNHPVLTDKGWVPAHLLCEGDDVIRGAVQHGRPHEQHRPSRIEDVWRAGLVSGLRRMPLSAEDFHADSAYGEVEIVFADSLLAHEGHASFGHLVSERLLVDRGRRWPQFPRRCPFHKFIQTGQPAPSGSVGGSGLSLSLGGRHGRHLGSSYLTRGSPFDDPMLSQPQFDYVPRYAVPAGQGEHAFACEVRSGDIFPSQRQFAGPRFDAPPVQFSPESRGAYASQGSDLLARLAGQVENDRIVKIRRSDFTGHVFNLETVEGWYSASSLLVSNCGCTSEPVIGDAAPSEAAAPDQFDTAENDEMGPQLVPVAA